MDELPACKRDSMTAPPLRALPWLGGKSPAGKWGTAQWIVSLFPTVASYVEPFFGMGGVFLTKEPHPTEWVNDIDGRLINWWKVIADPDLVERFCLKLETVGQAIETTHFWALENIDCEDPVDRAAALTVLIQNSRHKTVSKTAKFYPEFFARAYPLMPERVLALHQRIYKTQITQRDALEIIDRTVQPKSTKEKILMYLDPPYQVGISKKYAAMPDFAAMGELLAPMVGDRKVLIAISGYADEWDHLGYYKTSRQVKTATANAFRRNSEATERTENLWTNYKPPSGAKLF